MSAAIYILLIRRSSFWSGSRASYKQGWLFIYLFTLNLICSAGRLEHFLFAFISGGHGGAEPLEEAKSLYLNGKVKIFSALGWGRVLLLIL